MEYKQFKEIKLSHLGMGNMRLPVLNNNNKDIDYHKGQEMIDFCYKQGINYYDTAFIYHEGESEVFLGKALSQYPRESYYIADKFKYSAEPDYRKQFQTQLERLGTDYIDFYLVHGIADNNYNTYMECGCIEYFQQLKREGKIKYLGFSFHGNPGVLKETVKDIEWDFAQIQLNYYDWYYGTAKEQYDILTEKNIPIMVMEPIHGGMLASLCDEANDLLNELNDQNSIASWALRFVKDLDNVCVVLSGMSSFDQVKDNIITFSDETKLTPMELETIEKACHIQQTQIGTTCTACRYCVPHCPKNLEIPYLLKLYNEYKLGGTWRLSRLKGSDDAHTPVNCISCGICTKQCPQSIEVKEYLKQMTHDYLGVK